LATRDHCDILDHRHSSPDVPVEKCSTTREKVIRRLDWFSPAGWSEPGDVTASIQFYCATACELLANTGKKFCDDLEPSCQQSMKMRCLRQTFAWFLSL